MPTKKLNIREKFRGQKFFPFCMEVRSHGRHVREHLQYWSKVIGRVGYIANFQCMAHRQDKAAKLRSLTVFYNMKFASHIKSLLVIKLRKEFRI